MSADILKTILEQEDKRIRDAYPSDNTIYPVIEIIRAFDYVLFTLKHNIDVPNKQIILEKYKFGWGRAFSIFYDAYRLTNEVPLFAFASEDKKWIDQIIQHAGSLGMCSLFLDYCRAGLMNISAKTDKEFTFSYIVEEPLEYYERLSIDYYFSLANEIYKERTLKLMEQLPVIKKKLVEIVDVLHGEFISYVATQEIDDFYTEFGKLYIRTTQIIEDFDEDDVFGGIPYKLYLDFAEYVAMAAIMHRDCCMTLAEKTNHKIYVRNILTYCFSKDAFINVYSKSREITKDKIGQILACFTLGKENYKEHLSYPAAPCPPYFELGSDILMRSTSGCLEKPVFFLNRQLKRFYPKDYFDAVNRRENRFRKQVYSLFPDTITKIDESIDIKVNGQSTDIDAVVYDKEKRVLGLFQLKWQDTFSTSMRERFSRVTNLIPKSVEWINKTEDWLKLNTGKVILDKLKITTDNYNIEYVYLFVISRNHVHFSNHELDNRAIWASWHQVVEASAKMKSADVDPISGFAVKLKAFSPEMRKKLENIPNIISDFNFKFGAYTIRIKKS